MGAAQSWSCGDCTLRGKHQQLPRYRGCAQQRGHIKFSFHWLHSSLLLVNRPHFTICQTPTPTTRSTRSVVLHIFQELDVGIQPMPRPPSPSSHCLPWKHTTSKVHSHSCSIIRAHWVIGACIGLTTLRSLSIYSTNVEKERVGLSRYRKDQLVVSSTSPSLLAKCQPLIPPKSLTLTKSHAKNYAIQRAHADNLPNTQE